MRILTAYLLMISAFASYATDNVIDNTPDSLDIAKTARPVPGSTRKGNNPVLFLVGNSTMRTGTLGNGNNGQWGWGYFAGEFFDSSRITVENHALGGMSSRTFYNVLWPDVVKGINPGDWVIIELGHNDNGPLDEGRARATLKGTGSDSVEVTIKESGRKETVYTYGEYMRRYINDVKERGGYPILMSLTPRYAWDDKDSTIVTRVSHTYGLWAKQVADAEKVPFIDLNDITACKMERFGKEKAATLFYLDRIHTSEEGAKINAESAVEGIKAYPGLELASYLLPETTDTITGKSRKKGCPVVFTIGDSTVKNEDCDSEGMWGWGSVIEELFDTSRITVENHAMAGRSARTFIDENRWDRVYKALQPGDYVIMQFGHNDGGPINTGKSRGELPGSGDESCVYFMEKDHRYKVIHTFGWYLRKIIMDTKEKGAIPIVLSHTPRNRWKNGKIEDNTSTYGKWSRDAAARGGASFIDLNKLTGSKYQAIGEEASAPYFKNDHTHSSLLGAHLNASSIAEGIRCLDLPLKEYLRKIDHDYDMSHLPPYDEFLGYGYDFNIQPNANKEKAPYFFSVRIPDGNYKVTVTLGDKNRATNTTVRAESRRIMLNDISTRKGECVEHSFIVNKRSPAITLQDSVKIGPRETGSLTWDNKLTFEFNGKSPSATRVKIEPVTNVTTVFLCGNSTVVDQTSEPWTSWGQIIPQYFDSSVVISNHSESGESATSFLTKKRFDKVLSMSKPGDWVFFEFGHNDQKEKGAGKGAYYNFTTNLKIFIDLSRNAGLHPVLVTPTARRHFDEYGKIRNTHGDYIDAIREVAQREVVPLIELNDMTKTLYESLGIEGSKKAFVHYPANSFPGQVTPLADNTHFSPFGATEIAKCVIEGIRTTLPELAVKLIDTPTFDPSRPDNPESFIYYPSPFIDLEKPYGN